MVETRKARGWGGTTVLVILITLVGAAMPAAGELYRQVYPGQDSTVVEPGSSIGRALTRASLETGFDAEPVTEGVRAVFTATIFYVKTKPGRPTIKVGYANDASLKVVKGKFEITRLTDSRQYLDEGTKRPGGGFKLAWMWEIVPRQSGSSVLELQIQPVVILKGSSRKDLAVRNKPIRIDVKVHPNTKALAEVLSAARGLRIDYPDRLFVNKQAKVEASLPLKGHRDTVKADIALARGERSVDAVVEPVESSQAQDQLVGSWLVTPAAPGSVDLLFTVKLSTQAGDLPLMDEVILHRFVRAEPAPPSLWQRLQAPVNWLAPFVALLTGLLALLTGLFAIRVGRRRRRSDPDDGTGTANGDSGKPADG
jgi:hypothetical protein